MRSNKACRHCKGLEDDAGRFALMLEGTPFHGRFLFDGDEMLGHEVMLKTAREG